ncbi:putative nuclease HARBI1, partial [Temnothorax curvispinosus]|uniref:Putative nuclease HARBI1 n=1 Tax=Temnothorax curvispinosus TaxID=300111 RepID=A0A6J1QA44_9HYME
MDLEDVVINAPIMNALENVDIPERRRRRFHIREDPFELSNKEFVQLFRLNKAAATKLIEIVEPHLAPQTRISAINLTTKVTTALRFFASGSYQLNIGKNIYMGVSQPTVSRCIHEIINVVSREEIMNEWIKFLSTLAELNELRAQFYRKFEFPGTIGCIDCTHVAIFPPANNNVHPEHIYINRKGYHSINTQLICDWRLRIMHINARYPGSIHDTFIWNNSNAKTAMVHLYRRFPQKNFHLLGDSGYSLRPWMMTPIIGAVEGSPEALYNRKQMRCRALVEQCNGLLKMRFRCLLKHRVLHYSPPTASKIIYTCAVLHNMCIDQNVPLDLNDDNEDIDFGMYNENHIANERNMVERNVRRIDADLAAGR